MIDTHCHLTYPELLPQIEGVLSRAREAGVGGMITVGTTVDDARQAAKLAKKYECVYATVGVHPHYSPGCGDRAALVEAVRELSGCAKVVALGEMGLDRYYDDPPIEIQKKVFAWQLEVAAELDLPIIIHNRQATGEVVGMIRDAGIAGGRFVFHCFTGGGAELEVILELGAMVSFTGIVTFKNGKELADLAVGVPLERVMIETDAPYLTPEPYRKVRPNEPCYVAWVGRFLAERRGLSEQEFFGAVDENARRFFRLPPPETPE